MSALIHALVLDAQGGAEQLTEKSAIKQWKPSDGVLWLHLITAKMILSNTWQRYH